MSYRPLAQLNYFCRKNVFAETLTTLLCQARAVASLHTTEARSDKGTRDFSSGLKFYGDPVSRAFGYAYGRADGWTDGRAHARTVARTDPRAVAGSDKSAERCAERCADSRADKEERMLCSGA